MNRLLLITYHYPPIQGSSGNLRMLAYTRYLRELGWDVRVLSVTRNAYESKSFANESLMPAGQVVYRGFALDAARHLSVGGKYPDWLCFPDRWQSWILGGALRGWLASVRWCPNVILSSQPIPSAHCLGYLLARSTRARWVAEFRDPMVLGEYPLDARLHRVFTKIESLVARHADLVVTTTEGCRSLYAQKFARLADATICVPNGYDPELLPDFSGFDASITPHSAPPGAITLLHSGLLYPEGRHPANLFEALAKLDARIGLFPRLHVVLRASGHESAYRQVAEDYGVAHLVSFESALPYAQALAEMYRVDANLVVQGALFNAQIPAKLYECMSVQRPIVALADPVGETGGLLKRLGSQHVAALENVNDICTMLERFLEDFRAANCFVCKQPESFSRREGVVKLDQAMRAMS